MHQRVILSDQKKNMKLPKWYTRLILWYVAAKFYLQFFVLIMIGVWCLKVAKYDVFKCMVESFGNQTLPDARAVQARRQQCLTYGLNRDNYKEKIRCADGYTMLIRKQPENVINSTKCSMYYDLRKDFIGFDQYAASVCVAQIFLIMVIAVTCRLLYKKERRHLSRVFYYVVASIHLVTVIYLCFFMKAIFFGELSYGEFRSMSNYDFWHGIVWSSFVQWPSNFGVLSEMAHAFCSLPTRQVADCSKFVSMISAKGAFDQSIVLESSFLYIRILHSILVVFLMLNVFFALVVVLLHAFFMIDYTKRNVQYWREKLPQK